MLRRIVVGLDGSAQAESAVPAAAALARASGARLTLVQALPSGETLEVIDAAHPDVFRYSASEGSEDDVLAARAAARDARAYLERVAALWRASGITVDTLVVAGDPADVVIEVVTTRSADLVVLATRGRTGLDRLLFGSVAEAILRRSPVPVVLLQSLAPEYELAGPGQIVRLLVPLDGRPLAEAALPWAGDLARSLHAEVVLARILPPASSPAEEASASTETGQEISLSDERVKSAQEYLDVVAQRLRAAGVRVSTVVRRDQPAVGLVAAADAQSAALIVMATHGRTGLPRTLLGSVALEVVRQAQRPVVLVRPGLGEPTGATTSPPAWEVPPTARHP